MDRFLPARATDGLPGLALAAEPEERRLVQRPPGAPSESIVAHGLWQHVLWVGLLMGSIVLGTQAWAYRTGSSHWQTMTFTVLALSQMGHVLAIRSERESLFRQGLGEQIVVGVPDEVLVQVAEAEHARLIVLASLGRRAPLRWLLGSVAERTAQTAPVPVLVVRGAAGFKPWLRGERPLEVMIGVDLSESAKSALEWTAELRHLGACNVTVAHIAWPLEQARAGIPRPVRLDGLHPEFEQALLRDVTAFVGESLGDRPARVLARPGLGRLDVHLTELAEAEQADLLVVGSHQRAGLSRLWHGSVSRGALLNARMSVACVPVPIRVEQLPGSAS